MPTGPENESLGTPEGDEPVPLAEEHSAAPAPSTTSEPDHHWDDLHFEEIDPAHSDADTLMVEPTEESTETEVVVTDSLASNPTHPLSEGPAYPLDEDSLQAESVSASLATARMKHRWLMRLFFIAILASIYALLYWQTTSSR